jgi:DNA-binding response OmpR family regulator
MGAQDIQLSINQDAALELCALTHPQIIFTEYAGPALDGLGFVLSLRRSTMACRKAPVILLTGGATAQTITAARDAGVHEFLRKPFTIGDLAKRLEAVVLRSRSWVEAIEYIGPDRRRFNSAEYGGVRRRQADGKAGALAGRAKQALQILASAIGAIERDPTQALRAMAAQVDELQAVAVLSENAALGYAALRLDQALKTSAREGVISRREFEACAVALSQFMPASDASKIAS